MPGRGRCEVVEQLRRLIEELERYEDVLCELPVEDQALARLLLAKKHKIAAGVSA